MPGADRVPDCGIQVSRKRTGARGAYEEVLRVNWLLRNDLSPVFAVGTRTCI